VRAPGGSGRRDVSRGPLLPQRFSPNPPLRLAENTRVVRRRLCCYGNRFKLFASFARMLELSRGYHMAHLRGQAVKKSLVLKRSIVIAGHRTSVSLEDEFWKSLKEIAADRDMTLQELVAAIRWQSRPCQSIVGYSTFCAWRLSRSASLKRAEAAGSCRRGPASALTTGRMRSMPCGYA
jgi:predicted DNA-binding ribbon-helix-helix protein